MARPEGAREIGPPQCSSALTAGALDPRQTAAGRRAASFLDAARARRRTIPISGWSKFKVNLDALANEALRQFTGDPEAAIPGWHLHDLRRTCASLMTESGVSRHVVSKILNHAEQGVTGRYYDLFS